MPSYPIKVEPRDKAETRCTEPRGELPRWSDATLGSPVLVLMLLFLAALALGVGLGGVVCP